jgi:hypothetical protein
MSTSSRAIQGGSTSSKFYMVLVVVVLLGIIIPESSSYDLNYNPNLQSCNSITTDIKYGPSSVIKNLTNPEYYDFRKRPNVAHIIDEGTTSHLPDRTFVTLHLRSVVSIDQIKQTMTTRSVTSTCIYLIKHHLFLLNNQAPPTTTYYLS